MKSYFQQVHRAASALFLALAACRVPDRYFTSVSRGDGELYGMGRDYDSEDTRLEVGVSGPLWGAQEARPSRAPCEAFQPVATPTAPPSESGGLPWAELILLLGGAAGMKASDVGYRKYRERRTKP